MPRLRAVWAVLQAVLTLATLAWGAYLLWTTREPIWASGNFAAAVFFLVTVFLFAADHPDGRIVGVFGVAVFAITNGLLIYALLVEPDSLPRLTIDVDMGRNQVAWIMAGATAAIAVPESLLLLFGHGPTKAPETYVEAPPQG